MDTIRELSRSYDVRTLGDTINQLIRAVNRLDEWQVLNPLQLDRDASGQVLRFIRENLDLLKFNQGSLTGGCPGVFIPPSIDYPGPPVCSMEPGSIIFDSLGAIWYSVLARAGTGGTGGTEGGGAPAWTAVNAQLIVEQAPSGLGGVSGPAIVTTVLQVGTNLKLTAVDVETGVVRVDALGVIDGYWNYRTSTGMSDPGSGNVRFDATSVPLFGQVAISRTSSNGLDMTQALAGLVVGDEVYLQTVSPGTNYIRVRLTGAPTSHGSWFLLPIALHAPGSYGGSLPPDGTSLLVRFYYESPAGSGGLGGSGTPGTLPLWVGSPGFPSSFLGDSVIVEDLSSLSIGIGMTPVGSFGPKTLQVAGSTIQFATGAGNISYSNFGGGVVGIFTSFGSGGGGAFYEILAGGGTDEFRIENTAHTMVFSVGRASGIKRGGDATTGGLTFAGGLYISGSITGGGGSGTVTSVTAGAGLTGGVITSSGTIAVDFGSGHTQVRPGDDPAYTDARTPTAHAPTHKSGGSDSIKLDELAAPTNITTLNVSITAHGLCPILPNDATKFLNGVGAYTVPPGTTILNATVPPVPATGAVGNYYEDTAAGILYGPKSATGYGADQRPTVAGAPGLSLTAAGELGTRWSVGRNGRVVGARYQRRADSAGTITVRLWDSTGIKQGEIADTQSGTGAFNVAFPTPWVVTAGSTFTLSYSATTYPMSNGVAGVTNSADVAFLDYRNSFGVTNTFPNSLEVSKSYFVEPIFDADESWPVSVRQIPSFTAVAPGGTPASGGGTTTFLRADGTWATAVTSITLTVPAEFSVAGSPITTSGTLAITKVNQSANRLYAGPVSGGAAAPTFRAQVVGDFPALNGLTLTDPALGDTVPGYHAGNVSFENDRLLGLLRVAPGGRLTGTSGSPVADNNSIATLYYTPYLHDTIILWDGTRWVATQFGETSLSLAGLTASKPYDVFGFLSSGVLALEKLVWTNATTRATGISLQDGRYCKTGDKTRLYLGSFYSNISSNVNNNSGARDVWNMYNRCPAPLSMYPTAGTWTYTGAATPVWRQANASASNQVEFICGLPEATVTATNYFTMSGNGSIGLSIDTPSKNVPDALAYSNPASPMALSCTYNGQPGVGFHTLALVEWSPNGVTNTWFGLALIGAPGTAQYIQSGLSGVIET